MHNNNITTIVAHILQEQTKRHTTGLFGSSISIQQKDTYTCPKEILKLQDGIKKVVEQNKAVINLKIPNSLQKCPVNLCTSRPAGRNRSESMQGVEENNKRYQENPQL
jgi:hypothetical protein